MTEPIHSRGTGRSGPKRKTGCLTCRRRKVRCDENRPVCANCIRLRLDCEYVPPKAKSLRTSSNASSANASTKRALSFNSQASLADAPQPPILASNVHMVPGIEISHHNEPESQWIDDQIISHTNDLQLSDNFLPAFEHFDISTSSSTAEDEFHSSFTASTVGVSAGYPYEPLTSFTTSNKDVRNQKLLDHFAHHINPTKSLQPTHEEWALARRSLLSMARECSFLVNAIYSLSALHLNYAHGEDCLEEALMHYRHASSEVGVVMSSSTEDTQQLRQAFAATFLLTYIELSAQTMSKGSQSVWPVQNLQSYEQRVLYYHAYVRTWTGLSQRLLTWTSLVRAKAEQTLGSGILQQLSNSSIPFAHDTYVFTPHVADWAHSVTGANHSFDIGSDSQELFANLDRGGSSGVGEHIYEMINKPGYAFFNKSQSYTSRISGLDRHNGHDYSQGDIGMLEEAQSISSDLNALWTSRPDTMNFLYNPKDLEDILQPQWAQKILLHLRVYAANFFAQYIYLHRVAYKDYSATNDVQTAVERIIDFTKAAIRGISQRRSEAQSPSSNSTYSTFSGRTENTTDTHHLDSSISLPTTMVRPLFFAATESGTEDRTWVLNTLRGMNQQQNPSVVQSICLLEELLRRQDAQGRRIDHRALRDEIFGGGLSAMY